WGSASCPSARRLKTRCSQSPVSEATSSATAPLAGSSSIGACRNSKRLKPAGPLLSTRQSTALTCDVSRDVNVDVNVNVDVDATVIVAVHVNWNATVDVI